MITDTIADVLTRIRNAQRIGQATVSIPCSKSAKSLLEVLRSEGFVGNYDEKKIEGSKFSKYVLTLKYFADGDPAISFAKRVSRSGRRVYKGAEEIPAVKSKLGISIVSTSQGVMSDRDARKKKIGGEVLALIS